MAKYFMLECFEPEDWEESALFEASPQPPSGESWTGGRRFAKAPSEPLVFELDPTYTDRMLEMDNTDAWLITRRLLDALQQAGVNNLDVYQAVIRHPETGMESHDYVAVNVVGRIAAADLKKSNVVGGMPGNVIDTDFDGVVLDEKRTGGAFLFRLAENTNAIIVHENVKDHLEAAGFTMLTFLPPERWIR